MRWLALCLVLLGLVVPLWSRMISVDRTGTLVGVFLLLGLLLASMGCLLPSRGWRLLFGLGGVGLVAAIYWRSTSQIELAIGLGVAAVGVLLAAVPPAVEDAVNANVARASASEAGAVTVPLRFGAETTIYLVVLFMFFFTAPLPLAVMTPSLLGIISCVTEPGIIRSVRWSDRGFRTVILLAAIGFGSMTAVEPAAAANLVLVVAIFFVRGLVRNHLVASHNVGASLCAAREFEAPRVDRDAAIDFLHARGFRLSPTFSLTTAGPARFAIGCSDSSTGALIVVEPQGRRVGFVTRFEGELFLETSGRRHAPVVRLPSWMIQIFPGATVETMLQKHQESERYLVARGFKPVASTSITPEDVARLNREFFQRYLAEPMHRHLRAPKVTDFPEIAQQEHRGLLSLAGGGEVSAPS